MQPEDFKDITYTTDEQGIVTLALNTPRRKNALSALSFLEIYHAIGLFQADDKAYAMILTGAPDPDSNDVTREAFSSGGYFSPDAYEGVAPEIMAQIDMTDIAQKRTTLAFFQCEKPVIAAINGLAIGGGFTLCLAAADQIYLSEHAWLQLPFARLGIAAELASTFFLPRLLGFQRAKEILYFPERIDAQQAVRLGIANAVVPHAELIGYARDRALQLVPPHGATLSIRAMKRCMHQPHVEALSAALDLENEALNKLLASADCIEGMTARVQRRPAVFKGR